MDAKGELTRTPEAEAAWQAVFEAEAAANDGRPRPVVIRSVWCSECNDWHDTEPE